MDLTDRQRKLAFVGIVVALAAVGSYLTLSTQSAPVAERRAPTPAPPVTTTAPATPSAVSPTQRADDFDIYPLLPFSQRDFAAATDLAQRFVEAYGSYRHDEDPQAYVERIQGMATAALRTQLARGNSAPGIIEQRKQNQEVATADARIDSIRDIEKNSIIFLVTGTQHVTKTGKQSENSEQYAVTVEKSGGGWTVYTIEPADAGQAGDIG